ncbi:MAG: S-layer homology domain-containing protein [Acidimicrobiia bacterium]|nr:S-layer homology domain-containing protein [Acidimicrobiia bacterium]MDH4306029.1 S-layer homology domain-containing protein [Acidimicrobiia bacterium]MDH5292151.1 S-layer homology domain-containing protein [Acidimicrobiia bacterium]
MRGTLRTMVAVAALTALLVVPATVWAIDRFTDVPDSNVFHDDITWLADAGVTLGCNPPDNTQFCPSDNVTREQMAAFMRRLAENRVVDAGTLEGNDAAYYEAQVDAKLDAAIAELEKSQARVIENRVNLDATVDSGGKTVSSVTVSTTSGQTASVTVFSTMNAFDADVLQCSLSAVDDADGDYLQLPAASRDQLSGHRTFQLGENATATYYLFCVDSAETSVLEDIVLTAIVIPTAAP